MMRAAHYFTLLLVAMASVAGVTAQPTPAPAPKAELVAGKKYKVCIGPWDPMGNCDPTKPASTYTGYDVAAWRATAENLGWTEDVDWAFNCTGFGDMILELQKPTAETACEIGVGGITISTAREQLGIQFAYPTYRSSLAIMVYVTPETPDGWFFVHPFTWEVWVALGVTAIVLPTIAFIVEFLALQGRIMKHDWWRGIKEATWRGFWTVSLYEPFHVTSLPARTVAIVFGFCMLILINIYCASLTTFLTVSQLNTEISSVDDLRGKAVGTVPVYKSRLAKYGISATGLEFENIESAGAWIESLSNKSLVATVFDEPLQQYIASTSTDCSLRLLDAKIEQFDTSFGFNADFPQEQIDAIDSAILSLQTDGTLSALREEYVAIPSNCGEVGGETGAAPISFSQMWGLWVILGVAAVLSFGVLLISMWSAKKKEAQYQKEMLEEEERQLAAASNKALSTSTTTTTKTGLKSDKSLSNGSNGPNAGELHSQSISAMVEYIRLLCDEHEALQKRVAELEAINEKYTGYVDDDGDYVVDENVGHVPIGEDLEEEDAAHEL